MDVRHFKYFHGLSFSFAIACPAGMYSLGGATNNCTACPSGYECPSSAASPIACDGGMVFVYMLCRLNIQYTKAKTLICYEILNHFRL